VELRNGWNGVSKPNPFRWKSRWQVVVRYKLL